ncbi:MBL fold metallo-hydrolase [Candidatus Woesebacteria bacterium]|nr:MBL fold metallo-hydrolase [Candidatus Woesebacteria bacterium]
MDISYLGKDSFKIKAKAGTIVADPAKLTISHKSGGDDFVIDQPGEYEVEGISVFGYKTDSSNIYVIQFEDLRIAYLGNLTKSLSEKSVSELENTDVVIVSADNMPTKDLVEVVSKLEPYYVLPYGETIAKFVASYEHSSRTVKSLSLSKVSLPEDLTEVIVFE